MKKLFIILGIVSVALVVIQATNKVDADMQEQFAKQAEAKAMYDAWQRNAIQCIGNNPCPED